MRAIGQRPMTSRESNAYAVGEYHGAHDQPAAPASEYTEAEADAFWTGYEFGQSEYRREEAELACRGYHQSIDQRAAEADAYPYDDEAELFAEWNTPALFHSTRPRD